MKNTVLGSRLRSRNCSGYGYGKSSHFDETNFCFSVLSGKCAVIKTSTRQTYFLPVIGLVDPEDMKPGDLVGVNKDSYLILEKLPAEYDSRVKAMEVDSR
jgi:ATP-dependent 26S proteasome regulatory subunit